jgi:3-hydroxypropanoate dehydrogenase
MIKEPCTKQLFTSARTHSHWLSKAVADDVLKELYSLAKLGPTSANSCPARFIFVKGGTAKASLLDVTNPGNIDKIKNAPVTVIIAWDTEFYEKLPTLTPQKPLRDLFANTPKLTHDTAFRNSSLQGAYLMMAARTLGLDCGPMSGFDETALNDKFFPDGKWKVNFICNIGYGDHSKLHPRNPRLDFNEACKII